EVVHARLGGNGGGGQWIVAGDHHRLDAHAAKFGKALLDAALDDVLQLDDAENTFAISDDERRAALLGDAVHVAADRRRKSPSPFANVGFDGIGSALADAPAVQIDAAHARLGRERNERRPQLRDFAAA